jgi:hypothetical protein
MFELCQVLDALCRLPFPLLFLCFLCNGSFSTPNIYSSQACYVSLKDKAMLTYFVIVCELLTFPHMSSLPQGKNGQVIVLTFHMISL